MTQQLAQLPFTDGCALAAQRQPGGWFLARECWPDAAARELLAGRYRDTAEWAGYEQLDPRAQRQWLLGRVAVKDAVRQCLLDHGAGPLEVSLAQTGPLAAAIARPRPLAGAGDGGVGIDLQAVTEHGPGVAALSFSDEELALLDRLRPLPAWSIRFWAAKEAAAKAEATGLQGRPRQFAVRRVEGDRLLVQVQAAGGRARWVETSLLEDPADDCAEDPADNGPASYAVAWTTAAARKGTDG